MEMDLHVFIITLPRIIPQKVDEIESLRSVEHPIQLSELNRMFHRSLRFNLIVPVAGAVLGSVLGTVAIVAAVALFVYYRKKKYKQSQPHPVSTSYGSINLEDTYKPIQHNPQVNRGSVQTNLDVNRVSITVSRAKHNILYRP